LKSISSFASQVIATLGQGSQIDFLINNAGINSVPSERSLTLTAETLSIQMTTNVLGPAKVVEFLLPLLQKGSVVVNMTSGLSSMSYSKSKKENDATAYSISKAGLNMLTVHQSIDLKEKGVIVICIDVSILVGADSPTRVSSYVLRPKIWS
jgi:NAD(P)-dependent dehydrogenase (short-subunit alcohol dehydrogenase family)